MKDGEQKLANAVKQKSDKNKSIQLEQLQQWKEKEEEQQKWRAERKSYFTDVEVKHNLTLYRNEDQ